MLPMIANDELSLLIKSKYPAIFLESIDETYSIKQLKNKSCISLKWQEE